MKPSWASHSKASGSSKPAWVDRARRVPSRAKCINGVRKAAPLTKAWSNIADLRSKLHQAKIPSWFVVMVLRVAASVKGSLLYGVEAFSGKGELSSAFSQHVGAWEKFEIMDNAKHNLLLQSGFEILVGLMLRIGKGGLLWMGTPCKSWVIMSRSYTQRSLARPEGPPPHLCKTPKQAKYLQEHNTLADRTALLAQLAYALHIYYVVEQPQSSILFRYQPIAKVLKETSASTVAFRMANFQGDSPKPLRLQGTGAWMQTFAEVNKYRQSLMLAIPSKRLVVSSSSGQFTGISKELQASSGYTRSMGTAIAFSYLGMTCADVRNALGHLGL